MLTALMACMLATSCGGGAASLTSGGQHFSGNTAVNVMLSSTANDELALFSLQIQSLTLTGQSGNTVNLLAGQQQIEAIHVNDGIEPFVTAIVPQGIYTSATATFGGSDFTCIEVIPPGYNVSGSLDISSYAYGYVPNPNVMVNLPAPLTITGDNMVLTLNMQVLESASFDSCYPSSAYSITPTFNLGVQSIAAAPTNSGNGKMSAYYGEVSTLDPTVTKFSVTPSIFGGPVPGITVSVNSGTAYQGIGRFSELQVGQFVDMDAAVQSDGSLVATRIAVYDTSALNVMTGPLLQTYATYSTFNTFDRQQQGQEYTPEPSTLGIYSFTGSTSFQISSQLNNLANLPFPASFSGANMVPGQNMSVFSGTLTAYYGGETNVASTVTLVPQVIDGTILDISASTHGFTDYTVLLADYDLFPDLAVQQGQVTLLTNPGIVEVYVDSNTQMLNTQALAAGNTQRFYGLVFNDNGTLRMDCAQVDDGVAFAPTTNASATNASKREVGDVQIVRHETATGLKSPISVVTRSH
jgi:hypothetical protein